MRNIVTMMFMTCILTAGCTSPKWFELFEEVTYNDLEERPVAFCMNEEEYRSNKNPSEERPYLTFPMSDDCYASLIIENDNDQSRFLYSRSYFNDGKHITDVSIALNFRWHASDFDIGVKYFLPDYSPDFVYSRIHYVEKSNDVYRVFEAKEGWIEFSQIDTLSSPKTISGTFSFSAEDMRHDNDDVVSITEGRFENIPLRFY